MKKSALICVDDEQVVLTSLMDQLIHYLGSDYLIETAESGEEALEIMEELLSKGIEVPVIISDQIMPGMKGDELLIEIHNRNPQALKIFLTGQANVSAVGNAVNHANLYRYIVKPWDEADLRLTVTEALYSYAQAKQLAEQRKLLERLYDQAQQEISERKRVEKVLAETNQALRKAKEELEIRVQLRTAELEKANRQLQADIVHREEMEQALRQAKEIADTANCAKSAFLANMSHELRTPLNAILGFLQLLLRSQDFAPEQQEYLTIINRSAEHLLTLINQVLDLSKIEAGKAILHVNEFNFHALLEEVVDLFAFQAKEKGLQLHFELAPQIPQWIQTDEIKLRQILLNLLGNAVKFTDAGFITLRVALKPDAPDRCAKDSTAPPLYFEINDSGPGILPEEMDTLFEAFVQTASGQKNREGTGLGLAISQKFVQLLGGTLEVASTLGRGTTFSFHIPYTPVSNQALHQLVSERRVVALAPDQPQRRMLIVDDNRENCQLLTKFLCPLGFVVQEAQHGAEACALAESTPFDLIWIELLLPDLNGYELLKRLKTLAVNGKPRLIALTTSPFEEDRPTAIAAGFDDFLRKPFKEAEIFELLDRHLGVRFIYQDEAAHLQRGVPTAVTDLSPVTPELRERLAFSARIADMQNMLDVIKEIRISQPLIAEGLGRLTQDFQYTQILDLLAKAQEIEQSSHAG